MKARFRVTMKDGTQHTVEAENPDQAKTLVKNQQFREVDPGSNMSVVDRRSDHRTQVAKIEELTDEAGADRSRSGARGREDKPGEERTRDEARTRDEREIEERDEQARRDRETRSREGRAGEDEQSRRSRGGDYVGMILLALTGALACWLERTYLATDGTLYAGVLTLVSASGTAIGATLAALAAVSGDSLAVSHFPDTKKGWLLQVWNDVQVAGTMRIRSPKMHDNVNGIRIDTIISDPNPLLPWGARSSLYSGDTMIVELAGSAVAGDIEFVCMLQYFEELSAQHSKLLTAEDVLRRITAVVTVENTIATVATGVYGGAEAINAEIDQFQHNDEYAILGYKVDAECAAIGYRAPDFANVRVGGPGIETEPELTGDWFLRLSRAYGLALVPVFNAANKSSVLVDALQDENGTDVTLTTYLGRLNKG